MKTFALSFVILAAAILGLYLPSPVVARPATANRPAVKIRDLPEVFTEEAPEPRLCSCEADDCPKAAPLVATTQPLPTGVIPAPTATAAGEIYGDGSFEHPYSQAAFAAKYPAYATPCTGCVCGSSCTCSPGVCPGECPVSQRHYVTPVRTILAGPGNYATPIRNFAGGIIAGPCGNGGCCGPNGCHR